MVERNVSDKLFFVWDKFLSRFLFSHIHDYNRLFFLENRVNPNLPSSSEQPGIPGSSAHQVVPGVFSLGHRGMET